MSTYAKSYSIRLWKIPYDDGGELMAEDDGVRGLVGRWMGGGGRGTDSKSRRTASLNP